MSDKLFKITEFAKIASTNRKTLQYYDEIGLFSPAYIGENGYRYYSLLQLDQLALIAVLRDLGLPLREIKQYQECGAAEELEHLLEAQSREIDRCMELLQRRKAMLISVLEENRSFQRYGWKGLSSPCVGGHVVFAAAARGPTTALRSQLSDGRSPNRDLHRR